MNKTLKNILIASGTAAVFAATTSHFVTKAFVSEAIDRKEPRILKKVRYKLSDGFRKTEAYENSKSASKKLESFITENIYIESFDGTVLAGHYYPCDNAERTVLAMHGWRSTWSMDFCAIADFWHESGCNILFAEQRAQGNSDGDEIGFGLTERFDCFEWINWLNENKSDTLPIYLAGVSMGASTVLMASGFDLPENVHGIIADCGFTSPDAIFKHISDRHLIIPYKLRKKHIDSICQQKLNTYAGSYSTLDALKNNTVPVLFIHGTADTFVPISMTYENYSACTAPKTLFTVPGAEHGMSYCQDKDGYEKTVLDFFEKYD